MQTAELNDASLVAESLNGNREAFGQIVERHQNLISSLAYCATGNVGQSEDLAQETFVAAWKQLAQLREPAKLRAWLCGIVRFLISKEFRRQGREPIHAAQPLDSVDEWASPEPLPPDHAINEEEKALLWRALERIPQTYREPLVLYYREHESIEAVAAVLELSEDAVKQRLFRGRKLLQEQLLGFVAGALKQTTPGKAFTMAVLASIPGLAIPTTAKAATTAAAAKGGAATAKAAGFAGLLGMLIGPLIVVLPNYLAYRMTVAGARTEQERTGIRTFFGKAALIALAVFIPFAATVLWFSRHETDRSYLSGVFATALVLTYLPAMLIMSFSMRRQTRAHFTRVLQEEHSGIYPPAKLEYRSRATLLGLPLVHIRVGDRFSVLRAPVTAWIAVADKAVGGLFAFGGMAVAPLSIGAFAVGGLSLGGLSVGIIALGGVALGVWTLFGGLLVAAWQSFGGCCAIAWNAAAGDFAFARDYALGHFAMAAQANTAMAEQFMQANAMARAADFINQHWLWLTLIWMVPFLIQACIFKRSHRHPAKQININDL